MEEYKQTIINLAKSCKSTNNYIDILREFDSDKPIIKDGN